MTLIELKESLHKKIDGLNDQQFLEYVDEIITNKEEVPVISQHIRDEIEQGRRDIENGDFITIEELKKKYEQWLNE